MDPAAPGPLDPSVLTMQANHRSSVLWDVQVIELTPFEIITS